MLNNYNKQFISVGPKAELSVLKWVVRLCSKGVLQGSVLEPILFYIYINNLCDNMPFVIFHADDTVLY